MNLTPGQNARRIAAASRERDEDPTRWFERLYEAAEAGEAVVPWAQDEPDPMLVNWAHERHLEGSGRRALVVGCGLGDDAEFVAGLGFATIAFDIAPTAVKRARARFSQSRVDYQVADLLAPPASWLSAFDLVVENFTVQALPDPLRARAINQVASFVGPHGRLVVNAFARDDNDPPREGPPWPLRRAEMESFATGGLTAISIQRHDQGWQAEFGYPDETRR